MSRRERRAEDQDLEISLVVFREKVLDIMKQTTVRDNLTTEQRTALKELTQSEHIHISIADKTGEFVVMKKE